MGQRLAAYVDTFMCGRSRLRLPIVIQQLYLCTLVLRLPCDYNSCFLLFELLFHPTRSRQLETQAA